MSKFIPNSYQTPNAIVDDMMLVLSDAEFKIYHLILRNTVGWQTRVSKKLTIADIMELVNKSKPTVVKATKGLRELKLIKEHGTKRTGFSYSVNYEITGERKGQKWFVNVDDALNQWLNTLTIKERDEKNNGKNILPLMVKYFNHLYILNTNFKHNIKIYKKISEDKSKENKKVPASKIDLFSEEVFAEFKSKFEFINFDDYERMVNHLEKLFKVVSKKRVTSNLQKLKINKGRKFAFDAEAFSRSVDAFVKQVNYKGIWVQDVAKGKKNAVEELPSKKSENTMSDEELDAEIAKKLGEVA